MRYRALVCLFAGAVLLGACSWPAISPAPGTAWALQPASRGLALAGPSLPHVTQPFVIVAIHHSRHIHPASTRSPLPGSLLIADKRNNRLLLVGRRYRIKWSFPHPGDLAPGQLFLIPDDAFFTPGFRTIIATEEDYHVIREIDIRSRHIIWQYGHPGVPGSAPGYLDGPDDAYRLSDGLTTVADIRNCRVVFIRRDGRIDRQYGQTGVCVHDPPHAFASPNGDTPLPDGGMLVTEILGSWIDRLDKNGRLVWAIHAPLQYPSDAQLLANGDILICDYVFPGRVVEMDAHGRVVASFGSQSGPNLLSHPSLAISLPHGLIALNDDWNHRVIIADMRAQKILWQYGHQGIFGDGPGYLNTPDGIDFLPAHR